MDHDRAPRIPADHSPTAPCSETRADSLSALLADEYPLRPSQDLARVSADLDALRVHYMGDLLKDLTQEPVATLIPYVVSAPGGKRRDALEQLRQCASRTPGWRLTESSYCDDNDTVWRSSEQRHGLAAACHCAVVGPARGLLAMGRSAMPLDNCEYLRIIRYVHQHKCFLAFAGELAAR
ncbi:hypothetical protein AB0N81_40610 [Streptomyces sp. NPDC093510]|uniref:hypothetical protein n=1 Tax=Streptomyces sp. NPDC093510 TaxID=3155199 RepID=UPI00343A8DE1